MRKTMLAAFAAALLLAGTARAAGSQANTDQKQPSRSSAKMQGNSSASHSGSKEEARSVVGTVESVKGDTLTLKNRKNETHDLSIGKNTKFVEHGKQISKSDVKEGSEVRASFREDQAGKLRATKIDLMGTGSNSASTGKKPQTQHSAKETPSH
jgi:hypothetical protein